MFGPPPTYSQRWIASYSAMIRFDLERRFGRTPQSRRSASHESQGSALAELSRSAARLDLAPEACSAPTSSSLETKARPYRVGRPGQANRCSGAIDGDSDAMKTFEVHGVAGTEKSSILR